MSNGQRLTYYAMCGLAGILFAEAVKWFLA
jgi:hypothetical protein